MAIKFANFVGTMDVSGTQTYLERSEDVRTYVVGGSGATVTAGEWVQLDWSGGSAVGDADLVITAAALSTGNSAVVGVALGTAITGQTVQVQVAGYCANTLTVATAGDALVVGSTAGTAEIMAATDVVGQIGFATATTASGLGPAYIFRRV